MLVPFSEEREISELLKAEVEERGKRSKVLTKKALSEPSFIVNIVFVLLSTCSLNLNF